MKIGLFQIIVFVALVIILAVIVSLSNSKKKTNTTIMSQQVAVEDLAKLKELLDNGFITQEEYDIKISEKKKQLFSE